MSIRFKPSGALDVSTDPSDLPEQVDKSGLNFTSEAMTRCKNLRVDRRGLVSTRDGSTKFNTSAIETAIHLLMEQSGNRYAFAGTQIYENESSIATGLTDSQWSGVKYKAFNDTALNIFATNGTDRKRIEGGTVYEWGLEPPTVDAILGVGGGTGLTGDYNARYTYLRKSGANILAESNPKDTSDASVGTVTLADTSLLVQCEPPTDSQVTHIRLYRTTKSGFLYLVDQDAEVLADNDFAMTQSWESDYLTGTAYQFTTDDVLTNYNYTHTWEADTTEDSNDEVATSLFDWEPILFETVTADGSLGDEVAIDHTRPPSGSFVFGPAYNGTVFMIVDNQLNYCKPKQPEYWPALYNIEVSSPHFPGKTGVFWNSQPYYFTKNEIYLIQGTGHGTFFPLPMKAKTGAQGPKGAASVRGQGIYHVGIDGLYLFSGEDKKITEKNFEPLFRGEDVNGMAGVSELTTAWLHVFGNSLYFGYTSSGNTAPSNILVFNLETGRAAYYVYNDGSDIQISTIETDLTNDKLIVGDSSGFVRQIEDQSVTQDSGTDIPWEAQSKDFTLQTRKHFPRWTKYDVEASSATSVTGTVLLNGSVHQTHSVTGSRVTKRRLIDTGNGERCTLRIAGTGPADIRMMEME